MEREQSNSPGLRVFIAAAAATCVANATWWMQPLLMHYLVTGRGLDEASAGLTISVEMAALAIGSAVIARLSGHARYLMIACGGVLLSTIASLVTLQSGSYWLVLLSRAFAGVGMGAALMVSNALAARFADPDRAFARLGVVNLIFGAGIVGALPALQHLLPGTTPYAAILLSLVVMFFPLLLLPARSAIPVAPVEEQGHAAPPPDHRPAARNILLITAATFLIGVASGTVWAFYALIGEQAGLSLAAVDAAIAVAIMTAIGGAGLAAILGGRFGRVLPVTLVLVLLTSAVMALSFHPSATVFRVATCVNIAAIYFLLPYLLGAAAAQDSSGRGAAYAGSAFFFSGAVSPALGGVLVATAGIQVVGIATVAIAVLVALAVVYVERGGKAHSGGLPPAVPEQALRDAG